MLNNLALVLKERGCLVQARKMIEVALDRLPTEDQAIRDANRRHGRRDSGRIESAEPEQCEPIRGRR